MTHPIDIATRTRPKFRFQYGPIPVDLAGTRPVPHFFLWIIGFLCFALMSYLDHVHSSSSHFPDCITCSPTVPWLYHVLPYISLAVSHAPLQFPGCITCSIQFPDCITCSLQFPDCITCPHIPFGDTWIGKLSIFSPFVTFIDFTSITDISA